MLTKLWQRAGVAYRAKVGKELASHGTARNSCAHASFQAGLHRASGTLRYSAATRQHAPPPQPPFPYRRSTPPRVTGLLYEDVLIETEDVKLALSRLPKDVLNARDQRLKRAMVLSSQSKRVRAHSPAFRACAGVP